MHSYNDSVYHTTIQTVIKPNTIAIVFGKTNNFVFYGLEVFLPRRRQQMKMYLFKVRADKFKTSRLFIENMGLNLCSQ